MRQGACPGGACMRAAHKVRKLSCGGARADDTDDSQVETTVFELAGEDCAGLLADVTHLLTTNGCNVRSAAVRHPAAQAAPFRPCTGCLKLVSGRLVSVTQACSGRRCGRTTGAWPLC